MSGLLKELCEFCEELERHRTSMEERETEREGLLTLSLSKSTIAADTRSHDTLRFLDWE